MHPAAQGRGGLIQVADTGTGEQGEHGRRTRDGEHGKEGVRTRKQ